MCIIFSALSGFHQQSDNPQCEVYDTFSTRALHQPTSCSLDGRRKAAGKDDDAMISEILKQPICCISVPARELHHTQLC
jgi:hypothetical protein